ncbi:primosomal protein N' [Aeromicrobium sp.]|nr:primosomal protein N' [Candidatus Saccharibacteria bacterium]
MGFYLVWVRSIRYRGHKPLTYSCDEKLVPGQIVLVGLQKEQVLGFIERAVNMPVFKTKPIVLVYDMVPLPPQIIELARWLMAYYATNLGTATSQVLPAELSTKTIAKLEGLSISTNSTTLPQLHEGQLHVVKTITKPGTYVLHGKTGSGKTRVYLELAQHAVRTGKSALVLTPEISLTSQLSQSFRDVFGEQVVVLHSQLTPVQRQKVWLQILTATLPLVIVGPRSALFTPVANLGLLVIDEAHEPAYKQEQAPYYHARSVASKLAELHQAPLVIGSATPSVSDYFLAEQRQKPILRMTQIAAQQGGSKSNTIIVDLKDRTQFSRSPRLSRALLESIQGSLSRNEQSLVYLNRRGTARIVLCENCGWQALCPHCDLPLVYHADSSTFQCHTCGFHQAVVTSCPACHHPSVVFKSFGTKAITAELEKLFPNARIQRFDTDNKKSESFQEHFAAVKAGDVDILVGTQLLAKGLDLPRLSTLGIVLADSSLYMPDFSARERTYQLLSQALGRIGRGHVDGTAIVQTYQPDSELIRNAIDDNWDDFYQAELAERRKYHFPPFYYMLKLSCRRATYKSAETATDKLKQQIEQAIPGLEVDGPTPSFYEKLQGKYQCQLVLRSTQRSKLLAVIKLLPASGWTYDIDPTNLL